MIAICFNCGSAKDAALQKCPSCGVFPFEDDDLAASLALTSKALSESKLQDASRLIKGGQRMPLDARTKETILDAYRASLIADLRSSPRGPGIKIGLRGWALIVAGAALLFLALHPWPHYRWARHRDQVHDYEAFLSRFPYSDFSDAARERVRILSEEDVWATARASGQIETLRAYRNVYHHGKHLAEAKEKIRELADAKWENVAHSNLKRDIVMFLKEYPETTKTAEAQARMVEIADAEWATLANSRSLGDLQTFVAGYPESTKLTEARARIESLYNDWEWVRQHDKLAYYRRFLERFPTHEQKNWIDKRIIDIEVEQIAAGHYGELPPSQSLAAGGSSVEISIENKTGHELTVRYSGPDSKKVVIARGSTGALSLAPGTYGVAATVNDKEVRNFYGKNELRAGHYANSFHVKYGINGIFEPPPMKPLFEK